MCSIMLLFNNNFFQITQELNSYANDEEFEQVS